MELAREVRICILQIFSTSQHYLRYLVIPFIIFGASRLIRCLTPGPHQLPKLLLRNRVVLITGASSGLGKELAIKFYQEGAKLILLARGTKDLEKICLDLKTMPGIKNENEPVYSYFDMANVNEKTIECVANLSPTGEIDVLVNNAGISMRGSCEETTIDVHRMVMETNYFGHIHLTKGLLNRIPKDGAIIVTNSIQGKLAIPYRSAYSASKHAIQAFFDSLRCEKGPHFHILSVFAAYMKTDFGRHALNIYGVPVQKDDLNQLKGIDPAVAANEIYKALINRQIELTLAPFTYRLAIFLRWLCPDIIFYILCRRSWNSPYARRSK